MVLSVTELVLMVIECVFTEPLWTVVRLIAFKYAFRMYASARRKSAVRRMENYTVPVAPGLNVSLFMLCVVHLSVCWVFAVAPSSPYTMTTSLIVTVFGKSFCINRLPSIAHWISERCATRESVGRVLGDGVVSVCLTTAGLVADMFLPFPKESGYNDSNNAGVRTRVPVHGRHAIARARNRRTNRNAGSGCKVWMVHTEETTDAQGNVHRVTDKLVATGVSMATTESAGCSDASDDVSSLPSSYENTTLCTITEEDETTVDASP